MKTKLNDYLNEESSNEAFQELEELNALGVGNVAGYTGPLGSAGVGASSKLEKSFWKKRAGKKIKTASPKVHNSDALALQEMPRVKYNHYEPDIQKSFGAMHKPDFKGPAMPGLWKGLEDPNKPVKTGSPELDKDMEEII